MASAGSAWIPVKPKMDDFGRELDRGVTRSGPRVGKMFAGGFKKALKGAAIGATLGGALLVGGGLKLMKGAVQQASDLGESVNAVNVTFGKSAKGIHELGKSAATSLGLSRSEFNGLAVQFSSFAGQIAGKGGNVAGVMKDMTTRAADFASVMNLDVADAAAMFQSGLAGETEPLKKFGLDLSAAAVEAHAYAKGIANAGAELTEGEKVQARYSLLMEQTSKTAGDFANTSDSLANSQRILNARWKDIQARIGEKLLPLFAKLSTWFVAEGLPAIESTWKVLEKKLGPVFVKIGGFIQDKVVPAVKTHLLPALRRIGDFIADKVVPTVKDLIDRFTGARDGTNKVKKALQDAQPFIHVVRTAFSGLGKVIKDVALPILREVADKALPVIGKGFGLLGNIIRFWWNNIAQPILKFFIKTLGGLMITWGKMLQVLGKVPGFGWAKRAGDSMVNAGRKAEGLANNIKKIPPRKSVKVTVDNRQAVQSIAEVRGLLTDLQAKGNSFSLGGIADGLPPKPRASGGPVKAFRAYKVGEVGEERFVPNVDGRIVSNSALRAMENRPMLRGATYGDGSRGGVTIAEGAIQQTFPATSSPEAAYAGAGGRVLDTLSAIGG